jgi:hypothetical protein
MKRLTIEELRSQKGMVLEALETIKGGNAAGCHVEGDTTAPQTVPSDRYKKP